MQKLIIFIIVSITIGIGKTKANKTANEMAPEAQKVLCEDSRSWQRVEVCSTYKSPSGKYEWSTTGTHYDTIPNAAGCDSLMRILVVVGRHSPYIRKFVCDSFKPPSGKRVWYTSGIHRDTIKSVEGCDSILNYNLIVGAKRSMNIYVCTFYTSPSGKYTWTESGIYKDTIPSYFGCDSIITVNLKVNKNYKYRINDVFFDAFPNVSLVCSNEERKLYGNDPNSSGKWRSEYPGLIIGDSFFANKGPIEKEFHIYYDYGAYGCVGTDSLNIMINQQPEVKIINSDTIICKSKNPDKITIRAKTNLNKKLNWIAATGGIISPTAGDSIEFTPISKNDSINYNVLFVQTEGRGACPFASDRVIIHINPYPEIKITKSLDKTCGSIPVQFDAQILNKVDQNSLKYEWCFPNEDYSNKKNPIRTFTKDGKNIFQVSVTSKHGCTNTEKGEIQAVFVDTKISELDGTLYASNDLGRLTWLDCDSNYEEIPKAFINYYTPYRSGNFAYEAKERGCVDTSECLFVDEQEPFILTSNNPGNGPIIIKTRIDLGLVNVLLLNSQGRIVLQKNIESNGKIELNIPLKTGIYYLHLKSVTGETEQFKLLRY